MRLIRIIIIIVCFSAVGWLLSYALRIITLNPFYRWLSIPAAALAGWVMLTVTVPAASRNKWMIASFILAGMLSIFHSFWIINHTFEYREFSGVNRYVKGKYSDSMPAYIKKYGALSDEELLRHHLDGPEAGAKRLWTPSSIDLNTFLLVVSYAGFIVFAAACLALALKNVTISKAVKYLLMNIFKSQPKCRTFYNIKSRTLDLKGMNVGVGNKFDLGIGALEMKIETQETTEKIQALDLLQFNLCNSVKAVTNPETRDKILSQIVTAQTQMIELVLKKNEGK